MSEQSTALAIRPTPPPLSAMELKTQVQQIQQVMEAVMKPDEHYGKIPGCGDKPTLLQPGAQKLALTFGFASAYVINRTDLPAGHREYEVRCQLTHRQTGNPVGEGVGCATTMESKHRYRSTRAADTPTGIAVPKNFWDRKKATPPATTDELRKILADAVGQPGTYGTVKTAEGWMIVRRGEKIEGVREENPDIADTYNTVLKMAKKRAFVDAVLTATAASDIFTQDLEDLTGEGAQPPPKQPQTTTPTQQPQAKQQPPKSSAYKPAAAQPASQQQPPAPGAVGIAAVNVVKSGTKNNKPWTIYGIVDSNGEEYRTFSQTDADNAYAAKEAGKQVRIKFDTNQYGKNITELVVVEPTASMPDDMKLPEFEQPPFDGGSKTVDAEVVTEPDVPEEI